MRAALQKLHGELRKEWTPGHAGLALDRWTPPKAPSDRGGRKESARSEQARDEWLDRVAQCRCPPDYRAAFERWRASLRGAVYFAVKAVSRVAIGTGNASPLEVGLTLHHTWGVPVLPGSALKGLAAHYVETVYGPGVGETAPDREPFRGVEWDNKHRIVRGPGAVFRRIFGAPDVSGPGEASRAASGEVVFHDALWVPDERGDEPFLARDVVTVHHGRYYGSGGDNDCWPDDGESPVPVPFLTVRPGSKFLVALDAAGARGDDDAARLVERAAGYLKDALREWGLGAKTAAGYGRFETGDAR